MATIRVIAISTKTADLVRSTMKSPGYGHPAHTEIASGYGPCRHCLRDFRVGEEKRILFTYDAFYSVEKLPLPGPIFIHAEPCSRYDENAGFPKDMRAHRLTINAYGQDRTLLAEKLVEDGNIESMIDSFLDRSDVKYLHVRDTQAGCYDFRIERASR
ncbi:MAG TPA: DUF1203 domain-containing protein [Terriglobales bacterium]|nr:DUF1203 domain-containing protein [Terriglobales bacterium]